MKACFCKPITARRALTTAILSTLAALAFAVGASLAPPSPSTTVGVCRWAPALLWAVAALMWWRRSLRA